MPSFFHDLVSVLIKKFYKNDYTGKIELPKVP